MSSARSMCSPRQPRQERGTLCARLLAGLPPMIFGDGTQTRDFVFVRDIVKANLAAASETRLPHPIFNIRTGHEVIVRQLIDEIAAAANINPIEPVILHARAGGGSPELSRHHQNSPRELNFGNTPPLREGLRESLEWAADISTFPFGSSA